MPAAPDAVIDVLVVGAGPTGLTLAAQLAAFGARIRVIDRQLDRVHESRALAIQPRTLEVLRAVGVAHTLVERGNDAVRLQMHFERKVVTMRLFGLGLDDTAYPFLLFLSQAETEQVLAEHLAGRGVRIERGVELLAFEERDGAVACALRDRDQRTEDVRARYLVGCDGAHSSVRHGAGIAFEGAAYPQTFALGDVEIDGDLERGTAHVFVGARGFLFFFPLARPATWRMMAMRPRSPGASEGEPPPLTLEELQSLSDAFTDGKLRPRDPAWLTHFRLHHRQAARYRKGRIFLAGDAAHVHSPAGAQGMNTGIQDAWNLGWKLALVARGAADPALLDSYEPERLPVGRFVLRLSDRPYAVATSESWPYRLLRRRLMPGIAPVALHFEKAIARGFRVVSQLDVRYPKSPAVEEGVPALRRGPRAGDRLPDATVIRDGAEVSLQQALSGPAYQLLLCGSAGLWDDARLSALCARHAGWLAVHRLEREPTAVGLHDIRGEAAERLGVKPTAQYLVRPDGHVGYRCAGTDLDSVERHLARWLVSPALAPHGLGR